MVETFKSVLCTIYATIYYVLLQLISPAIGGGLLPLPATDLLKYLGFVYRESLECLPTELLTAILKELEWCDVLRVRQTSRRLREASKSLDVWLHLFHLYTDTSPMPLRLESSLDLYSQADLEAWLLRRIGADIAWKQDAKRPTEHRIINNNDCKILHLIEGGRWLLAMSTNGPVLCYDLDAPGSIDPVILIPAKQIVPISACSVSSAIDMLPNSPSLSFNLAIVHQTMSYTNGTKDPQDVVATSIFNVALNGNGRDAKLKATSLLLHSCESRGMATVAIDLSGRHLAVSSFATDESQIHLNIIDWTKMKGHNYPRRTIRGEGPASCIRLLPDGRVLRFFGPVVAIYKHDAYELVTSAYDRIPGPRPMWSLKLGKVTLHRGCVSEPMFDPASGSFSFMVANETHIQRLVLPSDHTIPPYLCQAMPYDNQFLNFICLALGKHRGFAYPPKTPVHLLTYANNESTNGLPESSGVTNDWHLANISIPGEPDGSKPVFDEATGRVALINGHRDSTYAYTYDISVFDFSLYFPKY